MRFLPSQALLYRLILAAFFSFSTTLFAASYVVPQTYDNYVNSVSSIQYGIIKQSTPDLSGNNYTIGSVSTKYRCLVVPKITCRSSPSIGLNAVVSEVNLKDPSSGETVNIYGTDIRVEEDPTNFYVCAAAYGGVMFDEFSLSVVGGTDLAYDYRANTKIRSFVYFTSTGSVPVPASTSVSSYITVQHQQTCR